MERTLKKEECGDKNGSFMIANINLSLDDYLSHSPMIVEIILCHISLNVTLTMCSLPDDLRCFWVIGYIIIYKAVFY